MSRLMTVGVAVVALLAGFCPQGLAKGSESVVKTTASIKSEGGASVLVVRLEVEKGWHVYANPPGNDDLKPVATLVTVSGQPKAEPAYPQGKQVIAPVVGNYRVYEGTEEIRIKLPTQPAGAVKVTVSFQACNEKSCLQPAKISLEVK